MVDGWKNTKLGNVVNVDPENLKSSTDPDYSFSYVSLSDIKNGELSDELERYAFKDSPSRARRVVSRGDVLLATVRPNLESFTKIKGHVNDLICSTGFAVLRSKVDIDSEYLYQYIYSKDIKSQIERLVVGSSYPAINSSDVKNLKLLLPPLLEQKKIADILSTVDETIQNTKAQIKKTKELKRGLMQKLFSEGIGHAEFKDSKLGRIPKEWKVVKLSAVSDVKGGFAFKSKSFLKSGKHQVLRIGNLYGGELRLDRVPVFIDTIDSKMIEFELLKDDLISTMTGTIGKRDFGYTIRIKSNDQLYLNQRVCRIRPTTINSTFLEYTTDTKSYLDQFFESASGGTGNQANIGTGSIANILIKVPSKAEQKKIGSILYQASNKIDALDDGLKYLENLKKGLMQKLLTGEVRVNI